ncbi:MAG: D-alanyl-D-alanine carboxypeptidase/D-alanyl-D-alanine-endopeptidase [Vicinamibacterales bacterium]
MMTIWLAFAPLRVVNSVTTAAQGSRASVEVTASALSTTFTVSGKVPVGAPPTTRFTSVLTPTQYFVNAARAGLIAEGIDVRGQAVDIDDISDAPTVDANAAIIVYRSQPLSVIASTLMQLSQNMYAETLLHTLGRLRGAAGTADAGRDVVRTVLMSWGIPLNELVMADGSGLSRYDLVTPDLLTSVISHVYANPQGREAYMATLPVAGRPGMLERRMKGTLAEGNATAKTGSFTNARALAGFVTTRDGEPLAYSLIANHYGIPTANIDRVMDAIVVSLAEFSRSPVTH